jgi:hypothetical protein
LVSFADNTGLDSVGVVFGGQEIRVTDLGSGAYSADLDFQGQAGFYEFKVVAIDGAIHLPLIMIPLLFRFLLLLMETV